MSFTVTCFGVLGLLGSMFRPVDLSIHEQHRIEQSSDV